VLEISRDALEHDASRMHLRCQRVSD
jgi:hypothetical protein